MQPRLDGRADAAYQRQIVSPLRAAIGDGACRGSFSAGGCLGRAGRGRGRPPFLYLVTPGLGLGRARRGRFSPPLLVLIGVPPFRACTGPQPQTPTKPQAPKN